MAVLYAVLVFYCQLSPGFYWGMIWTWGLVVAGIIDWQTGYIPDFISWGGIIISLGKAAWEAYLPEAVAAMLCLGGLLALLYLFSKGGLGWGDVKLLAAVGAVIGLYQGVIALMICGYSRWHLGLMVAHQWPGHLENGCALCSFFSLRRLRILSEYSDGVVLSDAG